MPRLILQPSGSAAARKHFEDTVEQPVPYERLAPHLDAAVVEEVRRLHLRQPAVWGVVPRDDRVNVRRWERARPGDVVLFTGGGGVFASGVVTMKAHSESLARDLWGEDDKGATWEYLYFLDEIRGHDIPYEVLNKLLGYKVNNVIQQFQVVAEEQSWPALDYLGLLSDTHYADIDDDEYRLFLEKARKWDSLDAVRQGSYRLEQPYLRKRLFGTSKTYTCAGCARELPVALLDAAHIKPRVDCTHEERLDADGNVLALCRLGCHVLFDKGLLAFSVGRTVVSRSFEGGAALQDHLVTLQGLSSPGWSEARKPYLAWHYAEVFIP